MDEMEDQTRRGRKRTDIWNHFTTVPGLIYSNGVKFVSCNFCLPDGVPQSTVDRLVSMTETKKRNREAHSEKLILAKPNFMAKHLISECPIVDFDIKLHARNILFEIDNNKRKKSIDRHINFKKKTR